MSDLRTKDHDMLIRALSLSMLMVAGCQASNVIAQEESIMPNQTEQAEWRLVIHGGAGVILRENMTAEREAAYTAALQTALEAGAAVLRDGGSAVDAVQAAVIPMEDDPLFNAGKGAVFTASAEHELDASIMSGAARDAGAVAGVKRVKNPILAARAVMEALAWLDADVPVDRVSRRRDPIEVAARCVEQILAVDRAQ